MDSRGALVVFKYEHVGGFINRGDSGRLYRFKNVFYGVRGAAVFH
jgi:hypothetical protein